MMTFLDLGTTTEASRGRCRNGKVTRGLAASPPAWAGAALLAALTLVLGDSAAFAGGAHAAPQRSAAPTAATLQVAAAAGGREFRVLPDATRTAGKGAAANSPQSAARFIDLLSRTVSATLADPALDSGRREQALRELLMRGFDTETIGRVVLGRHWRTATGPQRQEYRRLFQDFIVTSYANRLAKYPNSRVVVTGVRTGKRNVVIVKSLVHRPAKPPLRVDWLVRYSAQGYRVIDVVIAGISMAITQRSEFGSIIHKHGGDMEGLLAALRARTV